MRILAAALAVLVVVTPHAQDRPPTTDGTEPRAAVPSWPDFRGPTRDGHAAKTSDLPRVWSDDKNVVWKTEIRGCGWSSPVIANDRVWVTSASPDGREQFVIAVEVTTGKILLDKKLWDVAKPDPKHALNSYASPSPVACGNRVFVHFGTYGTACIDSESFETLWERRDLNCDHIVGPGSSPVTIGDLLVVHVDGGDVQYVVALDQMSGKTRWKTMRSVDYGTLIPDERKAYSTPIVIEHEGKQRLVSAGAEAVYQYDPATGKELWRFRYRGYSMSSRPVTDGHTLFLTTGFNHPRLLAISLDGEGDVTDSNMSWEQRRNVPTMPSIVLASGRIYMSNDSGIASCLDAATGKRHWLQRLDGEVSSSLLVAAGRVYVFDREGRTTVFADKDSFERLADNHLGDGFMASPAVYGNALVLRSRTHLYRIESR
ncbi:MAG: PQQ-binding-like beta-propeller repeat protein [Planctomycetes bacterium]|nr:PQQ-binding-like beta-propeller repeat protein [Planctomycetota bacterium]MCB9917762.1 PQQ-binding-like beta-propeller repeat protein [Planctomycetota bacterium]